MQEDTTHSGLSSLEFEAFKRWGRFQMESSALQRVALVLQQGLPFWVQAHMSEREMAVYGFFRFFRFLRRDSIPPPHPCPYPPRYPGHLAFHLIGGNVDAPVS